MIRRAKAILTIMLIALLIRLRIRPIVLIALRVLTILMIRRLIRLSTMLIRDIILLIGLSTLLIRTMWADWLTGLIRRVGLILLRIGLTRWIVAIVRGRPTVEVLIVIIWRAKWRPMRRTLAIRRRVIASTTRRGGTRAALGIRLGCQVLDQAIDRFVCLLLHGERLFVSKR